MKNNILFLTGHRKSGTSMLNTIFDGHKDFLVYPNDISILYAYYPSFCLKEYSFKKKKLRLIKVIKKSLNFRKKNIFFDKYSFLKSFVKKLNKKNINNINLILKFLIQSFIASSKQKKFKYVVIKETSCSLMAEKLFNNFKNFYMIQIVRDPRDNFGSLVEGEKKYYGKRGEKRKELLASLINRSLLDFEYSVINKKKFKKNFFVIRFEDLTQKKMITLSKICKFLNVKFNQKLLKPTIFGKPFYGNNFKKIKFNNISSINVNKWKQRIKINEASIIEFYLLRYLKIYKYKVSTIKRTNFILEFYNWYNNRYFFYDSFK